jgi:hypothetical protein
MLRLRSAGAASKQSSRSKAAIMIYLPGGPSHMDMYDLKPDAPKEFRGEFNPINTNVSGIQICEHMPMQARIAPLVRTYFSRASGADRLDCEGAARTASQSAGVVGRTCAPGLLLRVPGGYDRWPRPFARTEET